jgi:hypothetical protein
MAIGDLRRRLAGLEALAAARIADLIEEGSLHVGREALTSEQQIRRFFQLVLRSAPARILETQDRAAMTKHIAGIYELAGVRERLPGATSRGRRSTRLSSTVVAIRTRGLGAQNLSGGVRLER